MAPAINRAPSAVSSSSTDSERYLSLQRNSRSTNGRSKRSVNIGDERLVEVADNTERAIHWAEILKKPTQADADDPTSWKWLDNFGQFALFSRQEPHRFSVLASGAVMCTVPEIVHLLHAPTAELYLSHMEALYGEEFKDGAYAHHVDLRGLEEDGIKHHTDMIDLSVKSAIFGNDEKWCFVDAAYRRQGGSSYEKISTTLEPRDVESSHRSETSFHNNKHLYNITTAFLVQPEVDHHSSRHGKSRSWKQTRVYFYGELTLPEDAKPGSFDRTTRLRLLTMARCCDRLTELVRRRRLGLEEMVEHKSGGLFSGGPHRCACCNKGVMLLGVKHCRVCGQTVCTNCSHKHEREVHVSGSRRMMVEDVRVCDRCMDHVDRAEYPELNDTALLSPPVFLEPPQPRKASTSVLKDLLNEQLLSADSSERKASVMSVIKAVLDQDDAPPSSSRYMAPLARSAAGSSASSSRSGGAVLLTTNGDGDAADGLSKLGLN